MIRPIVKVKVYCSFCDTLSYDIKRIMVGPDLNICGECIRFSDIAIDNYLNSHPYDIEQLFYLLKPYDMKEVLDQYIVGQNDAKKRISVGVFNHYKRILDNMSLNIKSIEIDKSNILIVGPTGSGKTLLAQIMARIVNVPFCIVDATNLTEAGYVGNDVEDIVKNLYIKAYGDIKSAQLGIIYIDEIDKIVRSGESSSVSKNSSGEGVQQSLLKIIEGTSCNIQLDDDKKSTIKKNKQTVNINTSQILFMCGGTFTGIDKIIEDRFGKRTVGFNLSKKNKKQVNYFDLMKNSEPQDFIKIGLIPEFIGRLPVLIILDNLSNYGLMSTLVTPKNSLIKQYQHLFEIDGISLKFTKKSLSVIALEAYQRKTGARGLRSILEKIMLNIMYDIPGKTGIKTIIFYKDSLLKNKKPFIILKDKI